MHYMVNRTEFLQFRDIYSGNTLGDDPIAAAVDYACTLVDPAVLIHLTGIDIRSAEIVVTEAQVRRLAQVGAWLDVSVSLRSSG